MISRIAFSDMCHINKPSLTFIAQPMVPHDSISIWFWRDINVTHFCVNKRKPLIPNLWAVWGPDTIFTLIFASTQCLVLEHVCKGTEDYIAGVYASTSYLLRRQLWADLTRFQNTYAALLSANLVGMNHQFHSLSIESTYIDDYIDFNPYIIYNRN